MKEEANTPPRTSRKFATVWGELEYVCRKTHYWLYLRKNRASARRYLGRLQRLLGNLPENNLAILREEGLALLHELRGQLEAAMAHRQREIQLMESLERTVDRSVREARYDQKMAAAILAGRESTVLDERRGILRALTDELGSRAGPPILANKLIAAPLDSARTLGVASMRGQRRARG
jgi:hypothetical protein